MVIMLNAIGVFTVAPVFRTPAGLRIGCAPGARTKRPQGCRRMKGSRAHFHVVGLEDHASLRRPEILQRQNQTLKGSGGREIGDIGGHEEGSPCGGNLWAQVEGVNCSGAESEPLVTSETTGGSNQLLNQIERAAHADRDEMFLQKRFARSPADAKQILEHAVVRIDFR